MKANPSLENNNNYIQKQIPLKFLMENNYRN